MTRQGHFAKNTQIVMRSDKPCLNRTRNFFRKAKKVKQGEKLGLIFCNRKCVPEVSLLSRIMAGKTEMLLGECENKRECCKVWKKSYFLSLLSSSMHMH